MNMFRPAVRQGVKALILLYGPSGCGKTYSAIQVARGLVGPEGRIAFMDTEAGRGSHYANLTPYDRADLSPPFAPARYLEVIEAAEAEGYDALIIDSISHEWEGEGGVLEQAESIEISTRKSGLHCWNKPKGAHKKLINRLLRTRLHIIFCARAREKPKTVTNDKGRQEIVSDGFQPIVEKNFPYEMLISVGMNDQKPGVPDLSMHKKIPGELQPAFPPNKYIGIETGQLLRKWLDGAAPVDDEWTEAANAGREAARAGSASLAKWWTDSLDKPARTALAALKDGELKSIASAVDAQAAAVREFKEQPAGDPDPQPRTAPKRPNKPARDIREEVGSSLSLMLAEAETYASATDLAEWSESLRQSEDFKALSQDERKTVNAAIARKSLALMEAAGEAETSEETGETGDGDDAEETFPGDLTS